MCSISRILDHNTQISKLRFALLSPAQIRQQSVVEVTETSLYIKSLPRKNGFNDLRMGPVHQAMKCETCYNNVEMCNGHFGHIELSYPVYHIGFLSSILKTLRLICHFCCRLLCLHPNDEIFNTSTHRLIEAVRGIRRLHVLSNGSKVPHICPWCQRVQPEYKIIGGMFIERRWVWRDKHSSKDGMEWKSPEEETWCHSSFSAAEARSMLQTIRDDDVEMLGFQPPDAWPENMIMTVLVVPPPVIRPSIAKNEGSRARGQDDLTRKLQEILKASLRLKSKFEEADAQTEEVESFIEKLQYHVATYMNNDIRGLRKDRQRSGKPLRCLTQRIKGKAGRVRGNVVAKRCDYSARAVITPDSIMDIDEVGVPLSIARTLTVPERVNLLNMDSLYLLIRQGQVQSVQYPTGRLITLAFCSSSRVSTIRLYEGTTVHRYLRNGDYVTFNRQPSLHKKSIMAHRVRIMNRGNTIRLNLSCTTPYNADFDGDEANLMVAQNVQASSELQVLMAVPTQIMSAQNSRPAIGLVQDALVGCYLLTRKNSMFSREEVMNLMMEIHYPCNPEMEGYRLPIPAILKSPSGQILWTGKQIFSLLCPRGLYLSKRIRDASEETSYMDQEERIVLIRDGYLACGNLTKQILGRASNGVVDILCKDFGNETASRFLSDVQRVANHYLSWRGFSVGLSDCLIDNEAENRVSEIVNQAIQHSDCLRQKLMKQDDGVKESAITRDTSKAFEHIGRIATGGLKKGNALLDMIIAGSKGNLVDITQIAAGVGQQSVGGKRIEKNHDRTLPCYPPKCEHLVSRGFVSNSYASGLTPEEMYFHAMGAREGLVAVAVKTATTGYLQRRLTKALEAVRVEYDFSLRNAEGRIVDYLYGRDHMDASFLETVSLKWMSWSRERFSLEFSVSSGEREEWNWETPGDGIILDEEFECLKELQKTIRRSKLSYFHPKCENQALIPVNIHRLFHQVGMRSEIDLLPKPHEIVSIVYGLIEQLRSELEIPACLYLVAHIATMLCCRNVSRKHLSSSQLRNLCDEIERRVFKARISPCEMVGMLAAESVGEPATQLTLDSFHSCGQASKNIHTSGGVPRLKELIEVSKNIKAPCMTAPFLPCISESSVDALVSTLSICTLRNVVQCTEILFQPSGHTSMDEEVEALDRCFEPRQKSEWVIRFSLRRLKLVKRCLNPISVAEAIERWAPETVKLHVTASDANMDIWIVRVRLLEFGTENLQAVPQTVVQYFSSVLLSKVILGGFPSIKNAVVQKSQKSVENSVTGALDEKVEYTIVTQGSDLRTLLTVDFLDWKRVCSNDVHEVQEVLGLEVAIAVLFKEIKEVLSFGGSDVNNRHIEAICNIMTCRGYLMPLTRHGINRIDTGAFARASFEENMEMLLQTGFGEEEPLMGPVEQVCVGRPPAVGTGAVDLYVSPSYRHPENTENVPPVEEKDDDTLVFAFGNQSEEIGNSADFENPYDHMLYQLEPLQTYPDDGPSPADFDSFVQLQFADKAGRPRSNLFPQSANLNKLGASPWISKISVNDPSDRYMPAVRGPYRPSSPVLKSVLYRPSTPTEFQ